MESPRLWGWLHAIRFFGGFLLFWLLRRTLALSLLLLECPCWAYEQTAVEPLREGNSFAATQSAIPIQSIIIAFRVRKRFRVPCEQSETLMNGLGQDPWFLQPR